MNIISVRREIPLATAVEEPVQVILDLPGPFITGMSVWTDEAVTVSDVTLRLVEPPANKIFPEPSATIRTPLTEMQEDGWFHPSLYTGFYPLRIVVAGDPRYRVVLELCNGNGAAAVDIILNLWVSAVPPDQTTLELLKKMNSKIERIPEVTGKIASRMAREALKKQLGEIK